MRYLLILLLMIPTSSYAIERDKVLHVSASVLIGATSEIYFEDAYKSTALCMGVGLAKELYDEYDYGGFDTQDLVADAIGCAIGVYTGYQINVWTDNDVTGVSYTYNF
ncbi:conserved hypothetical protein [Vibrio phage 150E35-1]|nr:conserved hypothetical protein [Vibrio phage 150E35-1]